MNIIRDRYVVIKNGQEIFCGLARNYCFKPFREVGNASIKTYRSEKKAQSSFHNSWIGSDYDGNDYKIVKAQETIDFQLNDTVDPNQMSLDEYCLNKHEGCL